MSDVTGEPILIRCEGSEGAGNRVGSAVGCAMCGRWFSSIDVVPEHERDDILARIDRGDFG